MATSSIIGRSLRHAVEISRPRVGKPRLSDSTTCIAGPSAILPAKNEASSSRPYSSTCKPPRYGQPLHSTHPHLVRSNELTPGIPAEVYEERRRKLMSSLPEGSVVICMGGTVRLVSQSIFYKFRQATNFYYLTGFNEPEATVVLESSPSSSRGYKYTLFVPASDPETEKWEGGITGVNGATEIFGADEAYPNTSLGAYMAHYLSQPNIYASLPPLPSPSSASNPPNPNTGKRKTAWNKLFSSISSSSIANSNEPPHLLLAASLANGTAKPLEKEVEKLRLIKSPREIQLMKVAGDLSADAHTKVMRAAKPGISEASLHAIFEYSCAMGGAERPAYVPVVASGANALTIHYTNNDCIVDDGDLILIDAGCEYGMYASDITRTFPASGTFSPPQRDLYEAVLTTQKYLIKKCTVQESMSLNELQRLACVSLEEELKQIGFNLRRGDLQRRLYPHYIAHHLGSDLHDCPTVDRHAALVQGNVVTVEPGIYVPTDSEFPAHFQGIGIRIEDDIVVTDTEPLNLSVNAPKEIVDVEGACQGLLER